jgi:hypothetical protein
MPFVFWDDFVLEIRVPGDQRGIGPSLFLLKHNRTRFNSPTWMMPPKHCKCRPFMVLNHSPWPPSPAVAPRLNPLEPVEEEKTPYYHRQFYPAHLGQILNERYQIATKLGYGSSSTVWLARDLHRYALRAECSALV